MRREDSIAAYSEVLSLVISLQLFRVQSMTSQPAQSGPLLWALSRIPSVFFRSTNRHSTTPRLRLTHRSYQKWELPVCSLLDLFHQLLETSWSAQVSSRLSLDKTPPPSQLATHSEVFCCLTLSKLQEWLFNTMVLRADYGETHWRLCATFTQLRALLDSTEVQYLAQFTCCPQLWPWLHSKELSDLLKNEQLSMMKVNWLDMHTF